MARLGVVRPSGCADSRAAHHPGPFKLSSGSAACSCLLPALRARWRSGIQGLHVPSCLVRLRPRILILPRCGPRRPKSCCIRAPRSAVRASAPLLSANGRPCRPGRAGAVPARGGASGRRTCASADSESSESACSAHAAHALRRSKKHGLPGPSELRLPPCRHCRAGHSRCGVDAPGTAEERSVPIGRSRV